ncbi:MAG: hypothetical protein WA743_08445 [Pseudolabrys sp.]|jgi:hypothetical protein
MPLSDLQRGATSKSILRLAAAAIIAGAIVFATSGAPKATAPEIKPARPQAAAKAGRLAVIVKGSACSQHGWPNFEQRCQFDFRNPVDEARTVRVIALR